jgi:hypothetical protein
MAHSRHLLTHQPLPNTLPYPQHSRQAIPQQPVGVANGYIHHTDPRMTQQPRRQKQSSVHHHVPVMVQVEDLLALKTNRARRRRTYPSGVSSDDEDQRPVPKRRVTSMDWAPRRMVPVGGIRASHANGVKCQNRPMRAMRGSEQEGYVRKKGKSRETHAPAIMLAEGIHESQRNRIERRYASIPVVALDENSASPQPKESPTHEEDDSAEPTMMEAEVSHDTESHSLITGSIADFKTRVSDRGTIGRACA